MGEVATNFDAWERAEIARSDQEALHTPSRQLAADETQMARYMAPPLDSVFPLEYAYALLGNVTGRAVLDLGCGSGENSLLLARRGAKVIGVDISESLLALARQRLEVNGCGGAAVRFPARPRRTACRSLTRQSTSSSVSRFSIIWTWMPHRERSSGCFGPGGRAIFEEPVRDSQLFRAVRKLIPYRAPDVSPFERPLTTPELDRFAGPFRLTNLRRFRLPFVSLVQIARGFVDGPARRAGSTAGCSDGCRAFLGSVA